MKLFINYMAGLFKGIRSLLKGMSLTASYFFRPWTIVTEKYPENRKEGKGQLHMFDRFRGELTMPHNGQNEHRCTACGICQMNCPNGTIQVISKTSTTEDGKKKKELDRYLYNLGMCTFCNLCVKTCPSKALEFNQEFEHSVFNKAKLLKQLNREGSILAKKVSNGA